MNIVECELLCIPELFYLTLIKLNENKYYGNVTIYNRVLRYTLRQQTNWNYWNYSCICM